MLVRGPSYLTRYANMAVLQATMSAKSKRNPREESSLKINASPKPAKKVLLIAQDVKFARALSHNDNKIRDRALKRLKKWFVQRYAAHSLTENDFMRIWKGLFYSMWMSDKPLIQEECAENIAQFVHFPDAVTSLLFFKCGLQTLVHEWYGIDQLRLDKFLMFVRRLLRQGFVVLKNEKWKLKVVNKFGEVLMESVLRPKAENVLGLKMHFTDIYLEELAKISQGLINPSTVTQLILPFAKHLALLDDYREINHIKKQIFHYIIRQSDKGLDHEERYEAWKKSGFAGGSINCIVKDYIPSEEKDMMSEKKTENKPLDPRAGRVDVDLPQIKFSCKEIIDMLEKCRFVEESTPKARKTIGRMINEFSQLSKGRYPLDVKKMTLPKIDNYSINLKQSVNRLMKFERKLMEKEKKPKKRKAEVQNDFQVPEKKRKRRTVSDEQDYDLFARKLQEFMENSEQNVKKNKKLKKVFEDDIDLTKCKSVFKRNSGTWYVTEENVNEKPSASLPKISVNCSDWNEEADNIESNSERKSADSLEEVNNSNEDESDDEENFNCDEYYEMLLNKEHAGWENEAFEKYISPRKQKLIEINEKLQQELVENPFSKSRTPGGSTKKVKIALNLNQSQEFHEHQMQILKSPIIQFDSTKKPTKPLLKPSPVTSPINPFYRKKKLFNTSF